VFGVIKGLLSASGDENERIILGEVRSTVWRLRRFSVLRKRIVSQSLQGFEQISILPVEVAKPVFSYRRYSFGEVRTPPWSMNSLKVK